MSCFTVSHSISEGAFFVELDPIRETESIPLTLSALQTYFTYYIKRNKRLRLGENTLELKPVKPLFVSDTSEILLVNLYKPDGSFTTKVLKIITGFKGNTLVDQRSHIKSKYGVHSERLGGIPLAFTLKKMEYAMPAENLITVKLHTDVSEGIKTYSKGEYTLSEKLPEANPDTFVVAELYEYVPDAMDLIDFCIKNEINRKSIQERLEFAKSVIFQCLKGLEELHKQGVVHRDIKPGNILIFPDKKIKIIDWETLKKVEKLTRSSSPPVGTLAYKAPETFEEDTSNYSRDIYSLGSLLHYLTMSCFPFTTPSDYNNEGVCTHIRFDETEVVNNYVEDWLIPKHEDEINSLSDEIYKLLTENHSFIDFLNKSLKIDPAERMTLEEAFSHPFFAEF